MFVLPISFFAYFSEHRSISSKIFVCQILTYSTLLHLLRRNSKNGEDLNHYLNDNIHHFRGRSRVCVDSEASEKHLNPLKDVDKSALACSNIFSCLRDVRVTAAHAKLLRVHTERRMPTPAKMTLAGENSCDMNMRTDLKEERVLKLTRPAPAPRMLEKVNRTSTVGSSHFVHRSSLLRDWSSPWTCC